MAADSIFAVAGASADTSKYWYRIFKDIKKAGLNVYCVNPKIKQVEGNTIYTYLKDLPEKPDTLIIVIRPDFTPQLIKEAIAAGVKTVWFQPGTYNEQAAKLAQDNDIDVHDGCFMVQTGLW